MCGIPCGTRRDSSHLVSNKLIQLSYQPWLGDKVTPRALPYYSILYWFVKEVNKYHHACSVMSNVVLYY